MMGMAVSVGRSYGGRGWQVADLATASTGGAGGQVAGRVIRGRPHHPPAAAQEPFRAQQADEEE